MDQFNRTNLRELRETMLKEMEAVAAKYGLTAEFGRITFTSDRFGVRMEVKTNHAVVEEAQTPFTHDINIGTVINHPARKSPMRVVGFRPNAQKNTVKVETNRGKVYVISMAEAIKYAVAA